MQSSEPKHMWLEIMQEARNSIILLSFLKLLYSSSSSFSSNHNQIIRTHIIREQSHFSTKLKNASSRYVNVYA